MSMPSVASAPRAPGYPRGGSRSLNLIAALLCAIAAFGPGCAKKAPPPAAAVPDYDAYPYGDAPGDRVLDLGTMYTAMQVGFFAETLKRDSLLRDGLETLGWTLRVHDFKVGKDMAPYGNGRLDAMLLGDIAALSAMALNRMGAYALSSQFDVDIIAKRGIAIPDLKGRRIAFAPGTPLQFAAYRTLRAAGLGLADIQPLPLLPDQTGPAFLAGQAEACAVYEPFISQTLSGSPGAAILSRTPSLSFVLIDQDFADAQPAVTDLFLAALLRATSWAREDRSRMALTVSWIKEEYPQLPGADGPGATDALASLLSDQTIGAASFPFLPPGIAAPNGLVREELSFLRAAGSLPPAAADAEIASRFVGGALPSIVRRTAELKVEKYGYAARPLFRAGGKP